MASAVPGWSEADVALGRRFESEVSGGSWMDWSGVEFRV
jgi:hypothetical protein